MLLAPPHDIPPAYMCLTAAFHTLAPLLCSFPVSHDHPLIPFRTSPLNVKICSILYLRIAYIISAAYIPYA